MLSICLDSFFYDIVVIISYVYLHIIKKKLNVFVCLLVSTSCMVFLGQWRSWDLESGEEQIYYYMFTFMCNPDQYLIIIVRGWLKWEHCCLFLYIKKKSVCISYNESEFWEFHDRRTCLVVDCVLRARLPVCVWEDALMN